MVEMEKGEVKTKEAAVKTKKLSAMELEKWGSDEGCSRTGINRESKETKATNESTKYRRWATTVKWNFKNQTKAK